MQNFILNFRRRTNRDDKSATYWNRILDLANRIRERKANLHDCVNLDYDSLTEYDFYTRSRVPRKRHEKVTKNLGNGLVFKLSHLSKIIFFLPFFCLVFEHISNISGRQPDYKLQLNGVKSIMYNA